MRFIGNIEKDAQVRAVASGALSTGDTVVVNSNGTVSVVAETSLSAGSFSTFESAATTFIASTFDSTNNKVVIAYSDRGNSSFGTAVVGTVSGTSISFGTPVVFESGRVDYVATTFDSNAGKIVIAYTDVLNVNYGTAVIGTVSGTSISFGTAVVFESASTAYISAAFDSDANKVAIVYSDDGNADCGTAIIGTVSGTSISFSGSGPRVFHGETTGPTSVAYDQNAQAFVILYQDIVNTRRIDAIVATLVPVSDYLTYGTSAVVETGTFTFYPSVTYDEVSQKVVMVWRDGGNSSYGTARVGTVSGTTISVGTAVVFESANSTYTVVASGNGKILVAYSLGSDSNKFSVAQGVVSGTDISFDTPVVISTSNTTHDSVVYDSNAEKFVVSGGGDSVSISTSAVVSPAGTNLTSENFLGFADSGYANGQSAAINSTCTVDRNQSGLTAGQTYYVQTDGSLSTTAADPSVVAGTAISSTEIIVKG